ncbi:MAG: helix-turn-helix domain-containing protein [Desulfobacterales bacterium]|nr:helix-turn-helix domain-containing protein [Desulfobacterales bacterium]
MRQQIFTETIFTLQEAAKYLKISEEKVEKQVLKGKIPGRRIDDEWRFLKTSIDDWLKSYDTRIILLNQTGALSDDDTLDKLRLMIYSERGRDEKEVSE